MRKKRKICVVTGTRAEYGQLSWLMREIKKDKNLELQVIATGMHLSHEFGLTYKEIEKDGFKINKKIEMVLSADTPSSIVKSTGLGMIGFGDALRDLNPDIMVLLGDRYEMLAAAYSATISRIPIAHFHGGEVTLGAIDEPTRHAITKMSHFHFVSHKKYKKRIIQLGENKKNIYLVGGLGVEYIRRTKLIKKSILEKNIKYNFSGKNILITFHPVTLEKNTASKQFKNLLYALDKLKNIKVIFTMPNSDSDGRIIQKLIINYVKKNKFKSTFFTSLGQKRYLSCLKFVDAVVGNSSSGILEAPSFKVATINIGDRQKNRIQAKTIINCKPEKNAILKAFKKIYSKKFRKSILKIKNPYELNNNVFPSKVAVKIFKKVNLNNVLKKSFNDS
jgi:GDP/UDP-N,N'-diacetylbacillosamine 2-epimerase (hydrolysing)